MKHSWLPHIGSVLWKKRPIQLTFFVTRKCNARCPFCFYIDTRNNSVEPDRELSVDEIRSLSSSLGRLLWLAFSGGEIFLRKDLARISRIFYLQNKPSIMLYPTNGLMPDRITDTVENILRHCRRTVVVVKLSMDGLHDDHDAIRNTPGGFEKLMQSYRRLSELLDRYPNFELGINTLFCSENQDKMDDIIDFVERLEHVNTHTISLVRGNLVYPHYKRIDPWKYHHAIYRLQQNIRDKASGVYRFRGARLKAAQDVLQRRLIYRTLLRKQRQIPCYAGRLNLVLTESGDVYPCEMLSTNLGNVREHDYNMNKILRSEQSRSVLDSIQHDHCYCTHECYYITNILFNLRLYPALAHEYLRIRHPQPGRAALFPLRP